MRVPSQRIIAGLVAVIALGTLVWAGLRLLDTRERTHFREELGRKRGFRFNAAAGPAALQAAIAKAGDPDARVRIQVVRSLPDTPETLPVFLHAVQDPEPAIRWVAAHRLSGFGASEAGDALREAYRRRDLAAVAGAWEYFSGPFATRAEQQALADAFRDYGNEEMATALVGDRRPILSQAAAAWATQHGFMVMPKYR